MSRLNIARFLYRIAVVNFLACYAGFLAYFVNVETQRESDLRFLLILFIMTTAIAITRRAYEGYGDLKLVYHQMTAGKAMFISVITSLMVDLVFFSTVCLFVDQRVPWYIVGIELLTGVGLLGYELSSLSGKGIKL